MSRWSMGGVALLVFAFIAAHGAAQDKKDDAKKDAVKKDDPKKDDAKKDAAKKDDPKKDDPKKDDPKKPDPKPPTVLDKKEAEKKLLKTTSVLGEVTHIEPNKQAFRIKVSYQYTEANQGAMNAYVQEQAKAAQYAQQKNYDAARNALRAAAQHQANFYQVKTASKDVPIDAAENMKVRLPAPKAAFDDMGNLKKFTAKELTALRGPDKMFDGEFSDITNGQIVQITFVLPKKQPKPVKKDDIALKEEEKIEATRVMILKQPVTAKP